MTPLTSTLADLTAAKLIAYYPPPAPGVPIAHGIHQPAVYASDPTYFGATQRAVLQKYAVDVPDTNIAATFSFACNTWEQNGKSPTLPAPPAYSVFDPQAFNQWWAQYARPRRRSAPVFHQTRPAIPPLP